MSQVIPVSCTLNKGFVDAVKPAILKTWNDVGADAFDNGFTGDDSHYSNEYAIECCIDADRLLLNGEDEAAHELVRNLIRVVGYTKVLNYLSKHISLI